MLLGHHSYCPFHSSHKPFCGFLEEKQEFSFSLAALHVLLKGVWDAAGLFNQVLKEVLDCLGTTRGKMTGSRSLRILTYCHVFGHKNAACPDKVHMQSRFLLIVYSF